MLKYFKRLDVYKSSNGNNFVDLKEGKAVSYKWWTYACLHPHKKNTVLFNYYTYSNSTSKHQRDALRLFEEKGFNVEIVNIGGSQMTYENFLVEAPKRIIDDIISDHVLMNRKGSKSKTNEQRKISIQHGVKELERLVKLGVKIDINKIESQLSLALSEDLNKELPSFVVEKKTINKEKMIEAKKELNNFDEINLLTENINSLDEVTL